MATAPMAQSQEYDPGAVVAELRRKIASLEKDRHAALAREAALVTTLGERTAQLATRNTEFSERLAHQAAANDVLKAMSASPGDPQPVFELIAKRARELCNGVGVSLFEYDGTLVHHRAITPGEAPDAEMAAYDSLFPMVPTRGSITCRAILDRRIVHVRDIRTEDVLPAVLGLGYLSQLTIPLVRDGVVIGAITLTGREAGGFSDTQIELLQTFAEQAVMAITSAETYRALQTRTADLQESLEYQTATSNVLQVISRAAFDLQPVLDKLVETATRLCEADQGTVFRNDAGQRSFAAAYGHNPAYVTAMRAQLPAQVGSDAPMPGIRAERDRAVVHYHDATVVPGYEPFALQTSGTRTALGVPLLRGDEAIGSIVLTRRRVEPFTDRQINLVRTFADQAVIAMENTRLLTEQREALEQQTATAEVLGAINASLGNLAPVFDALLERAMRLCRAQFGSLYTYDGTRYQSAAQRGVPEAYAAFRAARPPDGTARAEATRTRETKQTVHILDMSQEHSYLDGHPGIRAMVDLGGARTVLAVPLLKDDTYVGYVSIYRQEVRPFSDRQITLLENFAAQAVIAMENARLLNEQREALERQTATAEVLGVINANSGDLAPVFDAILEKAHQVCGAEQGSLQLIEGEQIRAVAVRGLNDEFAAFVKSPRRLSSSGPLATSLERTVQVADMRTLADAMPEDVTLRTIVEVAGVRTWLALPLRRENVVLGRIVAARRTVRPFTEKQIALLEHFAAQAVIAMENARLISETREALAQQIAMAEVLATINANPGVLEPVFETILGKALTLSNSAFGIFLTYDGERLRPRASLNVPPALAEYLRQARFVGRPPPAQLDRRIMVQRLMLGEDVVQVDDARDDDAYRTGTPARVALVDLGGARSCLAVALRKDGALLGAILVYRQEVRPFTADQIALMNAFAAQGVIAMENARLLNEIRAARDEAETTLNDLRRTQDRLVQTEKMASLGQLTAGIAHEIKNPLNFVNNFSDLSTELLDELAEALAGAEAQLYPKLREDIADLSEMLKGNLAKIAEHGRRADSIVKNMLEHSRSGTSERRAVSFNNLVEEALNLAYHGARAEFPGFNITMEKDLDPAVGEVDLYPQEFTRVLLNLISNGFYATRKRAEQAGARYEPTLRIATHVAGDQVEITVRDNGTGVPASVREKIFEPFFTTKPAGEGTGLGLSLSFDIVVKQHGGQISVDSEPGSFTEFRVLVPRHAPTGEKRP